MTILEKLLKKEDLAPNEAELLMGQLILGQIDDSEAGGILIALGSKGETSEEIGAFAKVMRRYAVSVTPKKRPLLDIVGTGGDSSGTFNISTASMFVATGAGAHIAKHGNRAISSKCGSADVLEALGARLDLSPEAIADCIDTTGCGFMFAPMHHPATKNVMHVRKSLSVRTVFNILGPLTNPADPEGILLGVYSKELLVPMAEALKILGITRGVVVHGAGGLDEISTLGITEICLIEGGNILKDVIDPSLFGFGQAKIEDLAGGDAKRNADIIRDILSGEDTGPKRDIVALNAGVALFASGLCENFKGGIALAQKSIDSDAAQKALNDYITFTQR